MSCEVRNWLKRPARHQVKLIAAGRREGGNAFAVHVSDMSYDGCQIRSDESLAVGEALFLIVPRTGEICVRVKWVDGERAGLRFLLEQRSLDWRQPPAREG